jgi:hypothetical protein
MHAQHTYLYNTQSERQYTACHAEPRSGLLNKWLGGTVPIDTTTATSSESSTNSAFAPPAADADGTLHACNVRFMLHALSIASTFFYMLRSVVVITASAAVQAAAAAAMMHA